jgi:stage II sporulation protein D
MLRFIILFYLFYHSSVCKAQLIRIGLYNSQKIKTAKFSFKNGAYFIFSDTNLITKVNVPDIILLNVKNNDVELLINGVTTASSSNFSFISEKNDNFLETKLISPTLKARLYEGDFIVTNRKGNLEILNEIDLEQYLEGVIESEAGPGQKTEYYKVQAIISRTYAMKYKEKHGSSGFNLCDGTHCQAYLHKRNQSEWIDSAVRKTRGMVLLDKQGELAPTYFNANCGGQTCEPDIVWNQKIAGFSSFKDTFCIHTNQAKWTKKIPVNDWNSFLNEKYNYPIWDSTCLIQAHTFSQLDRKAFFVSPIFGIPLRDIRDAFKLKSTYFSCKREGDFIILNGHGFGHGVGLCQEGAMNMVKFGYKYEQILNFYYPEMKLFQMPISSFSLRK